MPEKRSPSETISVARFANGLNGAFPIAFGQQYLECWMRSMSSFTEEVARFVQARWLDDMDNWSKLAACRDPNEAVERQRRHVENAIADYAAEFGKLSRLAMDTTAASFSASQQREGAAASAKKTAAAA